MGQHKIVKRSVFTTDTINSPEYRPGMPLGKRIVLPSSYPGSPRAMQQNYLDAMTMVRKKGKPDFFVTMTVALGQVGRGRVGHDAVEPGTEARVTPEPPDASISPEVGVLHHVSCVLFIAGES